MSPWLSCWGLSYSRLNSREHEYKLRSCFWVSLSGPETQASCSWARTVNISGPHRGCTFYRKPHITSEPTPDKMTWIKKGIHHIEFGESMAQGPLLRSLLVSLKLPVSPDLSHLIPKMLLYPVDDTGAHMGTGPGHTSSLLSQHVDFYWAAGQGCQDSWPRPHHISVSWLLPSFRKGNR